MPEALTMPSLEKAMWSLSCQDDAGLTDVLQAVAPSGSVAGIAYTTAGARAITSVSNETLRSTDGDVDPTTVYELRLWKTDLAHGDDALAHEWRWVNGSGSAEITVWKTSAAPANATPCWYRRNAYLQHGAALPFDQNATPPNDPKAMTSIEVFTEQDYGNTVFVDEFMTGRWG